MRINWGKHVQKNLSSSRVWSSGQAVSKESSRLAYGDIVCRVKQSARIFVILARQAPTGVVFRRGPSKSVLLITWNTDHDIFEEGQWLKGRIYERRCDLSPEGDMLIYFAANWKQPHFSWKLWTVAHLAL
jgi:hypothetical protein